MTGTVIAELYDATLASAFTASTPRLVNVSVIKNVGSGFTMGFVLTGSDASTLDRPGGIFIRRGGQVRPS